MMYANWNKDFYQRKKEVKVMVPEISQEEIESKVVRYSVGASGIKKPPKLDTFPSKKRLLYGNVKQ